MERELGDELHDGPDESERDEQLVRLQPAHHVGDVVEERLVLVLTLGRHLEEVRRREEVLVHAARQDVARLEIVEHVAEVHGALHADRRGHERVLEQVDPVARGEARENAPRPFSAR